MAERAYNVLFLCVENSARSIMAEAILNHCGWPRFRAFSAGTAPRGEVHPLAIELLKSVNLPAEGLRSKSWREFLAPGSPRMDFVISLCDGACDVATTELMRALPGNPVRAHWGILDPVAQKGDATAQKNAFRRAMRELENRIRLFVLVRHEGLSRAALQAEAQ